MTEPIRKLLEERGCPPEIVAGGFPGLVAEWERTVQQVAEGYPLGLDDYLNDVDGRQIIDDVMQAVADDVDPADRNRLHDADARMKPLLEATAECLWGAKVGELEGWSREHNWWYFGIPRNPGPELRDDLGRA